MAATQAKERPILFSGSMVQAILDGRKTQTRRVITPKLFADTDSYGISDRGNYKDPDKWRAVEVDGVWYAYLPKYNVRIGRIRCPYGKPGDRLWVRETHWCERVGYTLPSGDYVDGWGSHVEYIEERDRAGWRDEDETKSWMAKRPSIHMPRRLCRILLEVVSVRVERVQDIEVPDAQDEGVLAPHDPSQGICLDDGGACIERFRWIWDSINDERGFGWDVNPWVWAVEFKVIGGAA